MGLPPTTRVYLTREEARVGCHALLDKMFGDLDRDCALLSSLRESAVEKVLTSGYGTRSDATYDAEDLAGATLAWLRASDRRQMPSGVTYESIELSQIVEIYAACAASTPNRAPASDQIVEALLEQAHAARLKNVDVETELRRCQSCVSATDGSVSADPTNSPRLPCRHLAELLPISLDIPTTRQARRALVVFYSRTGTTRRVASDLASLLSCEVIELFDVQDRAGITGYLRSLRDVLFPRRTSYGPPLDALTDYDLVVIGTPVWAGSPSAPIRSFLLDHAAELRQIAFFGTCGGRGLERTFRKMREIVGRAPIATLGFTREALKAPKSREMLTTFVSEIEQATHASRAAIA